MLVYLSFLICTSAGASCHTTIPVERPFMGLAACQMEGMLSAPKWQEDHPSWVVSKIRCTLGQRPKVEDEI
jgi:hypothetical protein